jgi:MFS family permease
MIVTLLAMACGQLLLKLSAPTSFELFVLVSILVSLALVPISLTAINAPSFEAPERISLRTLYRASPLGVVGAAGVGCAHSVLFGMGAVYATQLGLSVDQVAYFMMSLIIGGMLLQWPIGWLSDRFDRRKIIMLVAFLAAAMGLLALTLASITPGIGLFIAFGLLGGMALPLYSLCIAYTNDHLQPAQMVAASGSLMMLNGIGACMGPFSASVIMSEFGMNGFFWWVIIITAALGVFAVYRMTRRPSAKEQGHYAPLTSRTSPVAAYIYAEEAVENAEESDSRQQ